MQSTDNAPPDAPTDNSWRETLLEQCMLIHQSFYDKDPRKTMDTIITWHIKFALDPEVSDDAKELIDNATTKLLVKIEILQKALGNALGTRSAASDHEPVSPDSTLDQDPFGPDTTIKSPQ